MNVQLINPYQTKTKGEMVASCLNQATLKNLARDAISCGKSGRKMRWHNGEPRHWKANTNHCGRCVPCIIRRAALNAGGFKDMTSYEWEDLATEKSYPDIAAFRAAIARKKRKNSKLLLISSAPMPNDSKIIDEFTSVYDRGLKEVETFFGKYI